MKLKIRGPITAMYYIPSKKGDSVPGIVVNDGEHDIPIRCWKRGLTEGLAVGQHVQVTAELKGTQWQDRWFANIEALSIDFAKGAKPAERQPGEDAEPAPEDLF